MLEILIIISGVLFRLIPHMPNFAPLAASGIFAGAFLKKRYALIVPLASVILSDYLLLYFHPFGEKLFNFSTIYPVSAMFHSTTAYVWVSLTISGLIGVWLKNRKKTRNIVIASLLASIQFYLITNFGVWASGMYARGVDGLLTSYIMGIPFFQWTIIGDLFFTAVFFVGHSLAERSNTNSAVPLNKSLVTSSSYQASQIPSL